MSESPAPEVSLQLNALQALCRQVFLFRLAMIGLATPFALTNTAAGGPTWLVSGAVLITFMGSYALYRDWERFGPLLLRHPSLLAVDTVFGALLLFTATPDSTLAYVVVCTPLLAGLVYGWRGAGVFAGLQCVILALAYMAERRYHEAVPSSLLLPGFCVLSGAAGVGLGGLLLRFGEASRALARTRERLAVEEERAYLARELHDSVAKTLHGVALAAEGLAAASAEDPSAVRRRALLVARSARRAAAESRELLADLRREEDEGGGIDVMRELASRVREFALRSGDIWFTYQALDGSPALPPVPHPIARQLLTITAEALENAHRHAGPSRVDVSAGVVGDLFRISVYDDGRGLPPGTTLEGLRRAGHFGVVGMVERAAGLGARIRIGRGEAVRGTEVRVDLPLTALRV
ncbi:sensor histidine kinase [Streptomyces sp. CBMA152]|uniref:sensor histidine kinase n=1 Tax=Streptomyces sp. CBMA152 TaxID=1896312 RepID=UPI0016604556|nr:histidine kinase [Streptomyces sp. CBMA152]MBD0745315.1 two-component sensor histidine kinase [Streptomyces sp. CBMA152]